MNCRIESFFKEFNIDIDSHYTNGSDYTSGGCLSVDGSGEVASVNDLNSPYIAKWIHDNGYRNILDIGGGLGYLQRACDEIGLCCYSIEGSSRLTPYVVCNRNKYCIYDITKGVDERLKYSFDLTTSFEVVEHIHRIERDSFWNSLEQLSSRHLCSIHVTGGEHSLHKTIELPPKWMDYFNKRGYRYQILHWFPLTNDLNLQTTWNLCGWDCSIIMLIEF